VKTAVNFVLKAFPAHPGSVSLSFHPQDVLETPLAQNLQRFSQNHFHFEVKND
jgi:hypothetical protein